MGSLQHDPLFQNYTTQLDITTYIIQQNEIDANSNLLAQGTYLMETYQLTKMSIQSFSGYSQPYSQISQSYSSQLILNQLELNYGNPPQRFNVNPSCSTLLLLSVGISSQPNSYTFDQVVSYLSSRNTQISQKYDYFYSQSNPGELVSEVGIFYQVIQINKQQINNVISPVNSLQTIQFDLPSNQLTISFFLKFQQLPPTTQQYLYIFFDSAYQRVYFNKNNVIFGTTSLPYNPLNWNNIIIIKENTIMGGYITLFINNSQQAQIPYNNNHYRYQLIFFSSNVSYELNHFRIYSGSMLFQQNNCFLQSSSGSCIVCVDNYLLDFQNRMQCAPKNTINTDNEIIGVKDWNPPRKVCPKNMINDFSSTSGCKCLIGYYQEGDSCIKCPSYCRNCNNLNDCRNIRDSQGNCLDQNAFDDGQDCKLPIFILNERTNIRIPNQSDFGSLCSNMNPDINKYILSSDQLNLKATDSIFFSFSIQVQQFLLQPNWQITIAYIEQNLRTLLQITLNFRQVNTQRVFYVNYYINNLLQTLFTFESDDLAWIAFWTDNYNCIFMMKTKQFNYYYNNINCIKLYSSSSLQICTGRCDSIINNFCFLLKNKPITAIKNIPIPTLNGIDQMFSIYLDDFELFGRYKLDLSQINYQQYINDSSGNILSQPRLYFNGYLQKFNLIEGFQLNQGIIASLNYPTPNNYGDLLSISFNLEFKSSFQIFQFTLLQIVNQQSSFMVYIIPDFVQQLLYIQICYLSNCKTFKNAVLYFDQSNFLFISSRTESQLKPGTIVYYFIDVSCNYIQETFQTTFFESNQLNMLVFGDSQNQNIFLIDNINIYPKNVFVYYDYTKTDPCFIYINLKNMKCLHLKRGYYYYGNKIITKQECIQQAINTNYTPHIIEKDQTCILKISQTYQEHLCGLIEYINGQPSCTACKDKNSNPQKQCLSCNPHYFFNKQTQLCQICDPQCLECENQSNNCTQCQFINQITPTCNCIQQKTNLQNICLCNYKCGSCSSIDNNICFTCSSESRILPNCQCDKMYTEILQKCVETKIQCSDKCLTCVDQSENCIKCSQNRVNPPLCKCAFGYEEQKDGSCQICRQGTYYDPQLKICKQCSPQCISCNYQQCFQCVPGFQLQGFFCNCLEQQYQSDSNIATCLSSLSLSIRSFYQNNQYFISLDFSQVLKQFKISDTQLNQIITFYIPEIPQIYYSFINANYLGNQFQVNLQVLKNFQASEVIVILNTNSYFISQNEQHILNQNYLKKRMKVSIGPLIYKEQNLGTDNLNTIQNQLNQFVAENQNLFKVTNQLQLIFYFLNTLQPISVFLLLNASYPPQLYKFYQLTGTFIFPRVPDYQEYNQQIEFGVLGYTLNSDICDIPDYGKFKQLGFCQSILYFEIYQTTQDSFLPCQQLINSQSKFLYFPQLFPNIQSTDRIVLNIRYIPYGNILSQYTIISIHQSNNLIVSLSYNLQSNKIFLFLNGQVQEYQSTIITYSLEIQINLDIQVQTGFIKAKMSIQSFSGYSQPYSQISQSYSSQLILNQLELNYGNPPQRFNVNPSCSTLLLLSVGISSQPNSYTFDQIVSYLSSRNTQISQKYDYFYSQNNPGELISEVGIFQQVIQINNQQINNVISPVNSLQTIQFDLPSNQLTISFFLKFQQLPPSTQQYVYIFFDSAYQRIYFNQNNVIFGTTSLPYNPLNWNNIIIIKENTIMGGYITLFINNSQQAQIPYNNNHYRFQLIFFSSNVSYELNHFRIYSGSMLFQQNNCFLQSSSGSCIVCVDNYLLDFQNRMQCVRKNTINTDNEIIGVKDWNPPRKVCPKNMINDFSSTSGCKCLIGYYREGESCIKCPSYCRNCNSLNDCRNIRDSQGNCLDQNAFDDGQDCKFPLFILNERTNIRIPNQSDFGSLCSNMNPDINKYILSSDQLNLKATDSIFFSFSIQVQQFLLQPLQEIKIAYIQENLTTLMQVTLSFTQVNTQRMFYVKFYINNLLQTFFTFESDDLAWIAFWTNNQNCFFMMKTKQFNYYYYNINCIKLYSSSNLQICTGRCDSIINNFCLLLKNKPITAIKNIPNPTLNGIDQMFSIYLDDFELFGRYKLDLSQINYEQYINDSSGNILSQPRLYFNGYLQKFNLIEGFQLNQGIIASLNYPTPNNYGDLLSISFNLEFKSSFQIFQFTLLQIVNQQGSFMVYIIPDFIQQLLYIQICYLSNCKTLKNAVLYFDQSNFLFISSRTESQLKSGTIVYNYFDVSCNYIQETFQITSFETDQLNMLVFGDSQNQNIFLIDNINIYPKNVFVYYDYTKTDPCFLYINLKNMKCLHLKRGYYYYGNKIITKQECIQQAINTNYTPHIIEKDQICILKVSQTYQEHLCGLIEYINGQPSCTACKDKNSNPQKQCLSCNPHYFFNKQTQLCQICDPQCLECENQSNNCTQCQFINQITPTCNCIQQKTNLQNICLCNYKCGSCSSIDNNICFTCSSERRILPNCQCNQMYTEIFQECVETKIQCSDKCLTCVGQSENCTKCSQNRVNPPFCKCAFGYEEQQDGSCQICRQGTYYDPQLKICKQCSPQCISCNYQQCFQCVPGFQLQGFFCNCLEQQYQSDSNIATCLSSLSLSIRSFYQNNQYFISLDFSQVLKQFKISDTQLNQIITFYIPEIPQNYYSFINAQYQGNQFQVNMQVLKNFQASEVIIILNTNSYFISQNEQHILNQNYLKKRMKVSIGPLIYKEQNLGTDNLNTIQNQMNQFVAENQNLFKVTNQLQLIFYFLNTLQPISVFLLLNASYPPQLYKFYQLTGTFIFPIVPDYQEYNQQIEFGVFGYTLNSEICDIPDYGKFKQLGFCQSILEYLILYTERIQDGLESSFKIYYFQIQTLKKYSYLVILCFFYNTPLIVCVLSGILFFISSIYTILMGAYKSKISKAIKFFGELLFSIIWFIHSYIVVQEQRFIQNKVMEDDSLYQYITVGSDQQTQLNQTQDEDKHNILPTCLSPKSSLRILRQQLVNNNLNQEQDYVKEDNLKQEILQPNTLIKQSISMQTQTQQGKISKLDNMERSIQLESQVVNEFSPSFIKSEVTSFQQSPLLKNLEMKELRKVVNTNHKFKNVNLKNQCEIKQKNFQNIKNSVQNSYQNFEVLNDKVLQERLEKIIFQTKICKRNKYLQSKGINKEVLDFIEQQIDESLDFFSLYKEILFLKKAVMVILSREQLAALKISGIDIEALKQHQEKTLFTSKTVLEKQTTQDQQTQLNQTQDEDKHNILPESLSPKQSLKLFQQQSVSNSLNQEQDYVKEDNSKYEIQQPNKLIQQSINMKTQTQKGKISKLENIQRSIQLESQVIKDISPSLIRTEVSSIQQQNLLKNLEIKELRKVLNTNHKFKNVCFTNQCEIQQKKIKNLKNSAQLLNQNFETLNDKVLQERLEKIIFQTKFFKGNEYLQSKGIRKEIFDFIEQQTEESLDFFSLHKEILFLKKAIMVILSREQLAALKITGIDIEDLKQHQENTLLTTQTEEINVNYLKEQHEVLSSRQLQIQYINQFIQKFQNIQNVDTIDKRIFSSLLINQ
ncbi:hypothetical protein ABPG74_010416 [Tetrahymena malaccensis]